MDYLPFHILALFWTEGGSARDCIFAFEKLNTSLKKTLLNVMILPRPSNVCNKKNIHGRNINQLKNACNLQIRKNSAMLRQTCSSSDCYLDLLLICIWICHIVPHTNFVDSGFVEVGAETTICVTHIVDQQIC